MIGELSQDTEGYRAEVRVNDVPVACAYADKTALVESIVSIPIKKGQIVKTRDTYGQYDLKFYGFL